VEKVSICSLEQGWVNNIARGNDRGLFDAKYVAYERMGRGPQGGPRGRNSEFIFPLSIICLTRWTSEGQVVIRRPSSCFALMSKLFSPVRIGNTELKHRVVLAPLTRYRADDAHVPLNFVKDYYAQRASTPGTLLITEGTFISPRAGEFANVPGIYNDSQVKAWREVTEEIHAEGCYIFCQLWALGRAADPKLLEKNGHKLVSSGNIPMSMLRYLSS
jgi:hypothetical protein